MFRTFLTLGSLLLCLMAAVLWVRSYSYREWAFWADENQDDTRERCHNVVSLSGIVSYSYSTRKVRPGSRCNCWAKGLHRYSQHIDAYRAEQSVMRDYYWKKGGFNFSRGSNQSPSTGEWELRTTGVFFTIPYWFIVSLCSLGPLLQSVRSIQCAHARDGQQCAVCGYDLRATPERCPECGSVPKPPDNPPTMNPAWGQGVVAARGGRDAAAQR